MNEWLFFTHIFVVIGFVLAVLKYGNQYALVALVAIQAMLANVFVVKQMTLFGMIVTCSDVYSIGCILSLNLLQEYYGRDLAKAAVRISFLGLLFFTCMTQMHLWYIPAASDLTQTSFETIFSSTPRIIFASLVVFYVVAQVDMRFFAWAKRLPITQRVGLSLLLSQLLDTVLFSFIGLYGLVESVFDIIIVSYLVKCIMILFSAPFVGVTKRYI